MADEPSRKKRGAENQINKDNWEQEEEGDDGAEVRCAASRLLFRAASVLKEDARTRRWPAQPGARGRVNGCGSGPVMQLVCRSPLSARMRVSWRSALVTQRALRHSEGGQPGRHCCRGALCSAPAQSETVLKAPSCEQQSGPFKEAAADELAKRRIVKARRSGSSAGSLAWSPRCCFLGMALLFPSTYPSYHSPCSSARKANTSTSTSCWGILVDEAC